MIKHKHLPLAYPQKKHAPKITREIKKVKIKFYQGS